MIFTATDDCGNASTTTATFTIEDTTNPSIDMMAEDSTVECDGMGNMTALNDCSPTTAARQLLMLRRCDLEQRLRRLERRLRRDGNNHGDLHSY